MLAGSGGVVVGRSRLNRVCRLHKFEYERSWAWRSYYVSTLEFMPLSVRPFDFSSSTDKHELPAQHSTWLRTYFHYNFRPRRGCSGCWSGQIACALCAMRRPRMPGLLLEEVELRSSRCVDIICEYQQRREQQADWRRARMQRRL